MSLNIAKLKKFMKERYANKGNAIITIPENKEAILKYWFPDGTHTDRQTVEAELAFMGNYWDTEDINKTYFTNLSLDYSTGEVLVGQLTTLTPELLKQFEE